MTSASPPTPARVLFVHPGSELYGSDLQLVESVKAASDSGAHCTVILPDEGPLTALAIAAGAEVRTIPFPVIRKSYLSPSGIPRLGFAMVRALFEQVRLLRAIRPGVLYVNTVVIPTWILAARLAGVRSITHVHEAEQDAPNIVRRALALPLLASQDVIANSGSARQALVSSAPMLAKRTTVIYNGVPDNGPTSRPASADRSEAIHLALVGRLSPRKGTDVAIAAVGLLNHLGHSIRLDICGSTFQGYEWFEKQVRAQTTSLELKDAVHFRGYVNPTAPVLSQADIVLVPSRTEPFGNVAVEAMLASRPVIASDVQGLAEIVHHRKTGILVAPDDPEAIAQAVLELMGDDVLRSKLAIAAREDALERFSTTRYAREITQLLRLP